MHIFWSWRPCFYDNLYRKFSTIFYSPISFVLIVSVLDLRRHSPRNKFVCFRGIIEKNWSKYTKDNMLCYFKLAAMATGVLLTGNDEITGRLLSHVSLHVRPKTCKQFATGPLGRRENQFDLITADFPCQSRRINMEVILQVLWQKFSNYTFNFSVLKSLSNRLQNGRGNMCP